MLETIAGISSEENLLQFWRLPANRRIILVVDQLNVLKKGEAAMNLLNKLKWCHPYIFSASPNEESSKQAQKKQSGIVTMELHGGMDKVSGTLGDVQKIDMILGGNGVLVQTSSRRPPILSKWPASGRRDTHRMHSALPQAPTPLERQEF